MTSRRTLLAGAALVLAALVTVSAVVLELLWLAALGVASLVFVVGAMTLDNNRLARSQAARLRKLGALGPEVQPSDILGTVRLLQAQYTGRLDRAETTLEEAAAELQRARNQWTGKASGTARGEAESAVARLIRSAPGGSVVTLRGDRPDALALTDLALSLGLIVRVWPDEHLDPGIAALSQVHTDGSLQIVTAAPTEELSVSVTVIDA